MTLSPPRVLSAVNAVLGTAQGFEQASQACYPLS